MNEPNQICCPKCGSNQITANKKGFSGKKAVGGALLTGGIGILAGTIGSNKIIITCLNCGNQFKPGEKKPELKPKIVWDEQTKQHIKNPDVIHVDNRFGAFVILLIIIVFVVLVVRGCGGSTPVNNTLPIPDTTSKTVNLPTIPKPNINYQIISKDPDSHGFINLMFIYTKNMGSLKRLNRYLVSQYRSDSTMTLQIFYFDNKQIAKNYIDILKDQRTSDSKLDKVSNHVIGKYEYDKFDKIDSLKIGRKSDDF